MGTAEVKRVISNGATVTIKAVDRECRRYFSTVMYKDNPIEGFAETKVGDNIEYGIDPWPARDKKDEKGNVVHHPARIVYDFLGKVS